MFQLTLYGMSFLNNHDLSIELSHSCPLMYCLDKSTIHITASTAVNQQMYL